MFVGPTEMFIVPQILHNSFIPMTMEGHVEKHFIRLKYNLFYKIFPNLFQLSLSFYS